MIKIIYSYLLVLLLVFTSCSKDDDQPEKVTIPTGSIVAEINGIERTFNIDSRAIMETIPWNFGQTAIKLSISGKMDESPDSESILIWFFSVPVREIDEGTYPDLNKQIYQYLEYNSLWRDDLYRYKGNGGVPEGYGSRATIVRIDTLVQGTFHGNVIIGAGAVGEAQPPLDFKIRNGQFNLILE